MGTVHSAVWCSEQGYSYPAVRTRGLLRVGLLLDARHVEQVGVGVVKRLGHQTGGLHLRLLLEAGALPDELQHGDGACAAHARDQHHEHAAHAVEVELVGVVAAALVLGVALAAAAPLLPPPGSQSEVSWLGLRQSQLTCS